MMVNEPQGMICSKCSERAVVSQRYSGLHLCRNHFIEDFERRVAETLQKNGMVQDGEKIAVAVSGGKDSTALLMSLDRVLAGLLVLIAVVLVNGFELAEMLWTGRWARRFLPAQPLPTQRFPKVSLHLAICNEPANLVIETLDSLAALGWTQQAYRGWQAEHGGAVVNVASIAGLRASPGVGQGTRKRKNRLSPADAGSPAAVRALPPDRLPPRLRAVAAPGCPGRR